MQSIITRIKRILPHDGGAERLETLELEGLGYTIVVLKDTYFVGEKCIYFPPDTVLSDSIIEISGIEKALKKYNGKRCVIQAKEIPSKMGVWSEGFVLPIDKMKELFPSIEFNVGHDVDEAIGVFKKPHEEEKTFSFLGRPTKQNDFWYKYDVANWQRQPEFIFTLAKIGSNNFVANEKIEGMHATYSWNKFTGQFVAGQRSGAISLDIDYGVRMANLISSEWQFLMEMATVWFYNAQDIIFRLEYIGPNTQTGNPSPNYYELPANTTYIYDIDVNGLPIDYDIMVDFLMSHGFLDKLAPEIPISVADLENLSNFANGNSLINPNRLREGVVIKPKTEIYLNKQRLLVKAISPLYLESK